MMNNRLPVSIIMPVYNAGDFLRPAIESILAQTLSAFELIIINDGSVDESESIIQSFSDQRILCIHHENNKGLVAALNTGLAAASGKYIARMDQDDIALPGRMMMQYEFMEQHSKCVLLGTQVQVLGGTKVSNMYCNSDELKTSLLFGTSFAHPTVMIRTSALIEYGLTYEEQYQHAEDYGLWTRLSHHGDIHNIKQVGLYYRKHPHQYTRVFTEKMKEATRYIRTEYSKSLGLKLTGSELHLLHSIAENKLAGAEPCQFEESADLLNKLVVQLADAGMRKASVEKVIYTLWKQMCGDHQKQTDESFHKVFRRFKKSISIDDLRAHAWFLAQSLKTAKK